MQWGVGIPAASTLMCPRKDLSVAIMQGNCFCSLRKNMYQKTSIMLEACANIEVINPLMPIVMMAEC